MSEERIIRVKNCYHVDINEDAFKELTDKMFESFSQTLRELMERNEVEDFKRGINPITNWRTPRGIRNQIYEMPVDALEKEEIPLFYMIEREDPENPPNESDGKLRLFGGKILEIKNIKINPFDNPYFKLRKH